MLYVATRTSDLISNLPGMLISQQKASRHFGPKPFRTQAFRTLSICNPYHNSDPALTLTHNYNAQTQIFTTLLYARSVVICVLAFLLRKHRENAFNKNIRSTKRVLV